MRSALAARTNRAASVSLPLDQSWMLRQSQAGPVEV
jgi:hypothetical protein